MTIGSRNSLLEVFMPQFGRIFLPLIIMTSFDSLMASQLEKTTRYIVVLKKSATLSGGLTQALRGMGSSHLKVIRSTSKLLKTVTIAGWHVKPCTSLSLS